MTLSLIGAGFCWVFFPVLNMDNSSTFFIFSNGGISTLYCISAAVFTIVAWSLALEGKI
jgi:hypothetical protein